MLQLHTKGIESLSENLVSKRVIAKLTLNEHLPAPIRDSHILLLKNELKAIPEGFGAYFVPETALNYIQSFKSLPANVFRLPANQDFLADGDVVKFDTGRRTLSVLYRRNANYNALLVTEQCNNFCLMCSQPPKKVDDSYIVNELLTLIPLIDKSAPEIGITGGEPTLLGPDLIKILRAIKVNLPQTAIHILSNGRRFADLRYAMTLASLEHPDLMVGIPLYSDISNIHDYVVQADGAFDETVRGIINLKRCRQKVEIRVVIHKQTYARLPQLAEFIARNLLFVDHVALMGLEMTGFTKYNLDELWIDPVDYQRELKAAVEILSRYRMNVSIYNHQLCTLDRSLWDYSCKSISDWKNEYMPECEPCVIKDRCGGFFSSAHLRYSDKIRPFKDLQEVGV